MLFFFVSLIYKVFFLKYAWRGSELLKYFIDENHAENKGESDKQKATRWDRNFPYKKLSLWSYNFTLHRSDIATWATPPNLLLENALKMFRIDFIFKKDTFIAPSITPLKLTQVTAFGITEWHNIECMKYWIREKKDLLLLKKIHVK